MNTSKETGL